MAMGHPSADDITDKVINRRTGEFEPRESVPVEDRIEISSPA